MDVQVQSIRFVADQKLISFVKQRLNKLNLFFDHILDSEVYLKIDRANTKDNKIVEIKLHSASNGFFAKKQSNSFEESTDLAAQALRKQIMRHKKK